MSFDVSREKINYGDSERYGSIIIFRLGFILLFQLELSLKIFQRDKILSEENEPDLRERASQYPKILVNVHYDFQTKIWVDGETNEEIPKHLWRGHNTTAYIYPTQPFTPLYITAGLAFLQKNTSEYYPKIPRLSFEVMLDNF